MVAIIVPNKRACFLLLLPASEGSQSPNFPETWQLLSKNLTRETGSCVCFDNILTCTCTYAYQDSNKLSENELQWKRMVQSVKKW